MVDNFGKTHQNSEVDEKQMLEVYYQTMMDRKTEKAGFTHGVFFLLFKVKNT